MNDPIVYLNGDFLPLSRARISVLDRGFLFGDGVYEVIPAYQGKPFRLAHHLERLDNSLRSIRLDPPLNHTQWETILHELLHGEQDYAVYLQITRGKAPKRDHAFPSVIQPTVFVWANPIHPCEPQMVKAITHEDIRWQWCHIKAVTLLANVLLRQEALDQHCQEAILIRDGKVTEGAASNVFAVRDGIVVTPPKGPRLLPGVTRDLILELADTHGIPYQERDLTSQEMASAEEIWLSSSTRELLPVVELDGKPVGAGEPGPLWRRVHEIFQTYKQTFRQAQNEHPMSNPS